MEPTNIRNDTIQNYELQEIVIHNPKPNLKIRIPTDSQHEDTDLTIRHFSHVKSDKCIEDVGRCFKVAFYATAFFYAYMKPESLMISIPTIGIIHFCF